MEVAVLDACILFQGRLLDFLLCLAEQGVYEPVWSDEIHQEWMRNVHKSLQIPMDRLKYRRANMDAAFPGAKADALADLVSEVSAHCATDKQKKDAHVIATGKNAGATIIVTHNIPDFPAEVLSLYNLRKSRPDPFCVELLDADAVGFLKGVKQHRASLKRTSYTPAEYLDLLAGDKVGLPRTAQRLRHSLASI